MDENSEIIYFNEDIYSEYHPLCKYDILFCLFALLNNSDWCSCRRVCKRWYNVYNESILKTRIQNSRRCTIPGTNINMFNPDYSLLKHKVTVILGTPLSGKSCCVQEILKGLKIKEDEVLRTSSIQTAEQSSLQYIIFECWEMQTYTESIDRIKSFIKEQRKKEHPKTIIVVCQLWLYIKHTFRIDISFMAINGFYQYNHFKSMFKHLFSSCNFTSFDDFYAKGRACDEKGFLFIDIRNRTHHFINTVNSVNKSM